jgi:hypothetical protein
MSHGKRPRFSVVSASQNAAAYLPAYTTAIEAQEVPAEDLEVVVVDTGSTDGTLLDLQRWAQRAPFRVSVISSLNSSRGAAKNLGLSLATGDWLTFPELHDRWSDMFLTVVDAFQSEHPETHLVSGRPVRDSKVPGPARSGPRPRQYDSGSRMVDLDAEPSVFPYPAASFIRRELVQRQGLVFDEALTPFFDDSHFIARYLLGLDTPSIGLVRRARYLQRWSRSTNPAHRESYSDPDTYTTVLQRGYLDLLERGRTPAGPIAPWVQHLVIYELTQDFFREATAFSSQFAPPASVEDRFHELLGAIVQCLEGEQVSAYSASRLDETWADVLIHGYREGSWVGDAAELTDVDTVMRLQRVTYRYGGAAPPEMIEIDGVPAPPAFAKRRSISYFGRDQLAERILWLPPGKIGLRLGGARVPVVARSAPTKAAPRRRLRRRIRGAPSELRDVARQQFHRLAATLGRTVFRDAWVLIDRVHDAGDNGQRLFEHLRSQRRDVNAWFVLDRAAAEWPRLSARHGLRLVAYGSLRWKVLMQNAAWLLSSHTDDTTIVNPIGLRDIISRRTWRYAFLQHGVVHRDLSHWFNKRQIDLLVTSTPAEWSSMVADGTPYALTPKEVRETGLPRFDRLRALAARVPPPKRNLVVVAPTWRTSLTVPSLPGKQRRPIQDAFWTSEYLRRWLAVLHDPEILAAAESRGWRVTFMPHPNFQSVLADLEIPAGVERLSFTRHDAQLVYAHCGLLVTDYSSVAFDIAYIDRPVVYYQFDREDFDSGLHHGRRGYFEFERDGFGPVALDHAALVREVGAAIARGPDPAPKYQQRIDRTFPIRDGEACARVVAAVEEVSRPFEAPRGS